MKTKQHLTVSGFMPRSVTGAKGRLVSSFFSIYTALIWGLEFIIVVILVPDVCLFVLLFVLVVIYAAVNFPAACFFVSFLLMSSLC